MEQHTLDRGSPFSEEGGIGRGADLGSLPGGAAVHGRKKKRLRSQGTGMSTNILSLMMDGRRTVEEDLPYTGSGLGTLWRLLVEQVHKRIKVIETGNEKLRMEDMACELERKVCE